VSATGDTDDDGRKRKRYARTKSDVIKNQSEGKEIFAWPMGLTALPGCSLSESVGR